MSDQTVTVNDNLHKVDNILNALNYLLEEVQTRKNEMINPSTISSTVKSEMDTYEFRETIRRHVVNEYGEGLCREVAFKVMQQIDNDIEAFITNRVNKALEDARVQVSQNIA
jgi:hypothetical protein